MIKRKHRERKKTSRPSYRNIVGRRSTTKAAGDTQKRHTQEEDDKERRISCKNDKQWMGSEGTPKPLQPVQYYTTKPMKILMSLLENSHGGVTNYSIILPQHKKTTSLEKSLIFQSIKSSNSFPFTRIHIRAVKE